MNRTAPTMPPPATLPTELARHARELRAAGAKLLAQANELEQAAERLAERATR